VLDNFRPEPSEVDGHPPRRGTILPHEARCRSAGIDWNVSPDYS
jgi:hypothetical protein